MEIDQPYIAGSPSLSRRDGALGEAIFLPKPNDFMPCIWVESDPVPIRSFIGGSVMLGSGQGAMATPAYLRAEIARVRERGYSDGATGLIPGMAGLGVPIITGDGRAVAALSVGSTTDRMTAERNAVIAGMLKDEARAIGAKLNPFDPTLRRAGAAMEMTGAQG